MIKDEWREGHIGNLDEYIAFKWEAIQTARLHTPPAKEDIDEFMSAYSDSGDDYDHEKGGRALVFYSDALYDSDTLYNTFVEALRGYEYNAFNLDAIHKLVDIFGDDAIYQPCRELSVTIYIHAKAFIGVDFETKRDGCQRDIIYNAVPYPAMVGLNERRNCKRRHTNGRAVIGG